MGKDKTSPHDASGSAAGYLFQCRYALLLGLQAIASRPELHLSIEKFDDIAFVKDDSPVEQIQAKHHVAHKGNLTDASEDLWGTLRIWSSQVAADSDAAFRSSFILLTTAGAPEGSAASMLRAQDREEEKARTLLLATASKSKSVKNKPGYDAFRALPELSQRNLLKAVHIADASPNILDVWDDICLAVRLAVPKEHVEHLVERLEGWWFGVMANILMTGGTIPVLAIDSKLDELREEFSRASLPVHYGSAMPSTSVVAELDKRPFVTQLKRVDIGERRIEYAIRDYYRASEQRSKWARERLLVDGEVENYERELVEAWEPRFAAMVDDLPNPCDEKTKVMSGQVLYKWAEIDALFPLRSVAHRFLTHGSFHILANRQAIGWHPDFEGGSSDAMQKGDEK
jgi:hypothetical protein